MEMRKGRRRKSARKKKIRKQQGGKRKIGGVGKRQRGIVE